jgi:hypothetical protein
MDKAYKIKKPSGKMNLSVLNKSDKILNIVDVFCGKWIKLRKIATTQYTN